MNGSWIEGRLKLEHGKSRKLRKEKDWIECMFYVAEVEEFDLFYQSSSIDKKFNEQWTLRAPPEIEIHF